MQFFDDSGEKGSIPDLLKPYVWKTPENNLEALREIIRALPMTSNNVDRSRIVDKISAGVQVQSVSPKLCKEAELILLEAVADQDGTIHYTNSFEGKNIVANQKSLLPDNKPLTIAKWERGLEDLMSSQFVEDINGRGEWFKVKLEGYKAADQLINNQS